MDITFLTDYFIPVIIGICACLGFVIKKWLKDIDNKYIPTISAATGLVLALIMSWGNFTVDVVLSGLVSGLAATGCHQAITQLTKEKTKGDAE